MQIATDITGSRAVLNLNGRFDFHSHRDFRSAYESVMEGAEVRDIEINFRQVDYLDSSALGMLLLLRKHAGNTREGVTLTNGSKDVMRVLEIARFDQMFRILSV